MPQSVQSATKRSLFAAKGAKIDQKRQYPFFLLKPMPVPRASKRAPDILPQLPISLNVKRPAAECKRAFAVFLSSAEMKLLEDQNDPAIAICRSIDLGLFERTDWCQEHAPEIEE